MTSVDERLDAAVTDLRSQVAGHEPPPFRPKPAMPRATAVLLIVLIAGLVAFVGTRLGNDSSGVSIATQPAVEVDGEGDETAAQSRVEGLLTTAGPGEFILPIPGGAAWNADESLLLAYRTGAADPAHLVIDVRTEAVAVMPFTPADIEQIYWSPVDPSVMYYTAKNELVSFNVNSQAAAVVHTFSTCDRVDSGTAPVSPSSDGTVFGLLCHQGESSVMIAVDLRTMTESVSTTLNDMAPAPSPSGQRFVAINDDGSGSVLDPELRPTGIDLDLGGDHFTLVSNSDGREFAAAALYNTEPFGSLVLLPLDGGEPIVVVGPDTGFAYPPSGTGLSATNGTVAVSVAGSDEGGLAGFIHLVEIDQITPGISPIRGAHPHRTAGNHGFWSNPFVSLSPSGSTVAYASDQGQDRVNVYIHEFGN